MSEKSEAKPQVLSANAEGVTIKELDTELTEFKQSMVNAFEFAANELRPLFGQGTLALVFDGIAKGLKKELDEGSTDGEE